MAQLIVEACVTNERWRMFVEHRLPKINHRQRDTTIGGEDAERASSLASPRVTGIQLSDMLEGSSPDEISHLDLGLSKDFNGEGDDMEDEGGSHVLTFGRDVDDDDSDDSDDEEMDETDPARLAELQARYGFGAPKASEEGDDIGTADGNDGDAAEDDDWGFATGSGENGNEDDGNDGDVNFGGADEWGDFGTAAAAAAAAGEDATQDATEEDEEDVPPAPQATPVLPPPQES